MTTTTRSSIPASVPRFCIRDSPRPCLRPIRATSFPGAPRFPASPVRADPTASPYPRPREHSEVHPPPPFIKVRDPAPARPAVAGSLSSVAARWTRIPIARSVMSPSGSSTCSRPLQSSLIPSWPSGTRSPATMGRPPPAPLPIRPPLACLLQLPSTSRPDTSRPSSKPSNASSPARPVASLR
jgi:hypothetical protein